MVSPEDMFQLVSARSRLLTVCLRDMRKSRDGATWNAIWVVRALENLDAPWLDDEVRQARRALLEVWRARAIEEVLELDGRIRTVCTREGWKVDGQWPVLYVERAIEVRFREDGQDLSIGGDRLATLASKQIRSELARRVKALVPPKFSPREFLKQLAMAYDKLSTARMTQVPILEIYRQFVLTTQAPRFWTDARRQRFTELSAEQFRARLTRCLAQSLVADSAGRRLRLLPPIEPSDAMFLYEPAERRFCWVGRIEFIDASGERSE